MKGPLSEHFTRNGLIRGDQPPLDLFERQFFKGLQLNRVLDPEALDIGAPQLLEKGATLKIFTEVIGHRPHVSAFATDEAEFDLR